MSIFSSLLGWGKENISRVSPEIDLNSFSVDNSTLNQPVSSDDKFYEYFLRQEVLNLPKEGLEIGVKDKVLDYVVITLESFKGKLLFNGANLELTSKPFPEAIESLFGEPYWTDNSDGEKILFYEYNHGLIELQFEFSDGEHLSHITFMKNGVLSAAEQRRLYHVHKPWPPEDDQDK